MAHGISTEHFVNVFHVFFVLYHSLFSVLHPFHHEAQPALRHALDSYS
jgi:hypothetical protein